MDKATIWDWLRCGVLFFPVVSIGSTLDSGNFYRENDSGGRIILTQRPCESFVDPTTKWRRGQSYTKSGATIGFCWHEDVELQIVIARNITYQTSFTWPNTGWDRLAPPSASEQNPPSANSDPKPSFDCAKAKTDVEQLICTDATLAAMDAEMAALYLKNLKAVKDRPDQYALAQRAWREIARDGCQTVACLKERYRTRIDDLKRNDFKYKLDDSIQKVN